jgi:hypothetical protein
MAFTHIESILANRSDDMPVVSGCACDKSGDFLIDFVWAPDGKKQIIKTNVLIIFIYFF